MIAADVKLTTGLVFTKFFLNRIRAVYEHSREIELTNIFGANYFAVDIDYKPFQAYCRIVKV